MTLHVCESLDCAIGWALGSHHQYLPSTEPPARQPKRRESPEARTTIWSCGCVTTRSSRRVLTVIGCTKKTCVVLTPAARGEGTQP